MGIDHLIRKTVGFNGIAQLMGIAAAVLINREQIQLVLAFQNSRVTVAQKHIEKKAQVEMGVVSKQKGIAPDHFRDVPADSGFGDAPLPQILIGNACELFDLGRYKTPGA